MDQSFGRESGSASANDSAISENRGQLMPPRCPDCHSCKEVVMITSLGLSHLKERELLSRYGKPGKYVWVCKYCGNMFAQKWEGR